MCQFNADGVNKLIISLEFYIMQVQNYSWKNIVYE